MPHIVQYQPLSYDDPADTLFMAGTQIVPQDQDGFTISGNGYVIVFEGTGLTYGPDGRLLSGTIDGYRLYSGTVTTETLAMRVDSNFELLSAAELMAALDLFDAGDASGASSLVMTSWLDEFYWQQNFSGGLLTGYDGDESLGGGVEADIVIGRAGNDAITLGGGDDVGLGGTGADRIWGNDGNDLIAGAAGNDILYGDDGNDLIRGGLGLDRLYGGNGDDEMRGGADDDALLGEVGDDALFGGGGDDDLDTGAGNDLAVGGSGDDTLLGRAGDDVLRGNGGEDDLQGGDGFDRLIGGDGNDVLVGGFDDDVLIGGDGDDVLKDGRNSDRMTGGEGADDFVILELGYEAESRSVITDFELGIDRLNLRQQDGFTELSEVLAIAEEGPAGVTFDLGDGQSLVVLGVTLDAIADDILF